MLREDMNYTSLPQEEGTTPSSSFITTRSAPTHNQRDCKIATILTVGIIIAGLGLAATIPFIVKGLPRKGAGNIEVSPDDKENNDYLSSHLNVEGGNVDILDNRHHNESDLGQPPTPAVATVKIPVMTSGPPPVAKTEDPPLKPHPIRVTFEPQVPVITTAWPLWFLSSSEIDENTDDEGPDEIVDEVFKPEGSDGTGLSDNTVEEEKDKPEEEEEEDEDGSEVNIGGNDQGSVTTKAPNLVNPPLLATTGYDVDMSKLLNSIYGEEKGRADPSSANSDSWMGPVGTTRYKVTLVTLASVVAVALAAVIAAIGILIYSRVASRRRRINIQNVITDLQSRDKVVLLNSESEEE